MTIKTLSSLILLVTLSCGGGSSKKAIEVEDAATEAPDSAVSEEDSGSSTGGAPSVCYLDGDCPQGLTCANGTCIKPGSQVCSRGYVAESVTVYSTETSGECDQFILDSPREVCMGTNGTQQTRPGTCPTNNVFAKCVLGSGVCVSYCSNCKASIVWYLDIKTDLSTLLTNCQACNGTLTTVGCTTDGCACSNNLTCNSNNCLNGVCSTLTGTGGTSGVGGSSS